MESKIITVFGATGAQGSSVLRSLINAGHHVRASTRNPNSDKAKSLAKLENVSVVAADLDDSKSLDNALKGAYGAFLVTDFLSHIELKEVAQGKRAIDSAIKNNVQHLVFSGLENAKSVTGKDVFHFDFKKEIEDYGFAHKDKINFSSVRLPAYFENFLSMFLHKIGDKQYVCSIPMGSKRMYGLSVDDLGGCVSSIFENPKDYKSKIVPLAASYLTLQQYVDVLNKHCAPNKFFYKHMPAEQFEKLPFPGAVDLARMFEFFETEKMFRDIGLSKKLNKNIHDFESWVIKNREKLMKI